MHFMEGSNYLANNTKLYLEAIISIIDKYISLILAIFYYLLRKLFIINLCQVFNYFNRVGYDVFNYY